MKKIRIKRKLSVLWKRSLKWLNQPSVTSLGAQEYLPLWQSVLYDEYHMFILVPLNFIAHLVFKWPYRAIKYLATLCGQNKPLV